MTPVLAIANPEFVVVGGAFAVWAVLVAFLGATRHQFPFGQGAERAVMGISALLAVGAVTMGIAFAENGPKGGGLIAAKGAAKTVPAAAAPSAGGAPAGGATTGGGQTLQLSADPSGALKFDTTTLSAKAGPVKIAMHNPAPLGHNISLQGPGGVNLQGATVMQGATSQVSATLKPGTYTFYCSVPGHRQAGMQGTLTVK